LKISGSAPLAAENALDLAIKGNLDAGLANRSMSRDKHDNRARARERLAGLGRFRRHHFVGAAMKVGQLRRQPREMPSAQRNLEFGDGEDNLVLFHRTRLVTAVCLQGGVAPDPRGLSPSTRQSSSHSRSTRLISTSPKI
jgi:hypothetical protein